MLSGLWRDRIHMPRGPLNRRSFLREAGRSQHVLWVFRDALRGWGVCAYSNNVRIRGPNEPRSPGEQHAHSFSPSVSRMREVDSVWRHLFAASPRCRESPVTHSVPARYPDV
jgi:hypothetical protein